MKYILALDQGTSSSRAILYDHEGTIRGLAQREFEQIYPKAGWVEHDPGEIWASQMGVAIEALSRGHARPRDIAAIGITDQRETTIVWERASGAPVYNAIVWQDRRTAEICQKLREKGLEDKIRAKTGLLIDPYFSGTKISWILDNVEGARKKAEAGELAFGTVDSWLVWNLTGGQQHVIEITNASRTLIFNIHTKQWDDELLAEMNIPRSMLPEVRSSSQEYGKVLTTLGLEEVMIAGIAGDQQAALFGQACYKPGMAKCTYGTGAFLLQNIGSEAKESKHRLLTTIAWQVKDSVNYAMEGSVFVAGSVVQWLRDGLKIIQASEDVEALALSVPDSGDVYLVPAFTGLGAPHWDPHARGTLTGLTRGTTSGHIARAAIESIAFQTADLFDALRKDSHLYVDQLRVDGGAARNDTMLQFQADLLGMTVVRPAIVETTSLGAAYLAGLAVGFWSSQEEIEQHWKVEREFEPKRSRDEMNALRERWTKAVGRSREWVGAGDKV